MRRHHPAPVGHQPRAEPRYRPSPAAQRVLRAVALGWILGGVEQRVHRLLALAVDDPQHLAVAEHGATRARRPATTGRKRTAASGSHGSDIDREPSVFSKARRASGDGVAAGIVGRGPAARVPTAPRATGAGGGAGSSGCGAFDSATSRSISARRSTKCCRARSRRASRSRPCAHRPARRRTASRKGRCRAGRARAWRRRQQVVMGGVRRRAQGAAPPSSRSCRPRLSAVMAASTRPMSDSSNCPVPKRTVHCSFIVSGALIARSGRARSTAITATVAPPSGAAMRIVSARGDRVLQYQPPGIVARCRICFGAGSAGRSAGRPRRRGPGRFAQRLVAQPVLAPAFAGRAA